ncbi:hypothetical protein QFC22_002798 [Naganishia vaughanmartiniae]|uniref:Uncharacterized protein n=1 Tax=Naganishia vaughanmartiniae TaxID=1424756 RepID=A0ACC2XA15_9TREE|nr:hypothetical protein QFC22_002798 [Naganishia vaughanmartiniae]
MAKQPRLPASDRAPTSEQRNRGVRAYPTSTTSTFPAQPQQSVATHEIADAPNKSIRREDASGSSLPLTHSGKLLSHVENPAYSFTQHQATSRPKQLPTSITPEGNRNGHRLPRAMPTSGGSTAEPTNSREPRTSSDSPDLTSKSGPKSNEGNSESSHRVKQIPTAPRSDRPRVLSKAEEEEQARRQARIQRFSEVKQALSNDASQQQLERPVQQAASVQARRTSQEQARPSRTSASNALLQMKDREPATSSSAVNDPVLTDGWPITANQEELSAHTAQISDQHPAQNTNNSSPVNFGSPNVALPITVRHNGQNIYHHDGHGGTGSIGIAQDHVMAGDGASHARAPAEEDGMVVICDIPKEELSSVGASRAQRSSATPNVNMENTNDGDVDVDDRSRRGSTPLTPSPSEAGDLPGESEGTDISETRSQPAKVAGVPENSNKEKLSRSRREEDSRADQTPRAKSRSGPSLAKPMEPEQVPKSPSVPPMSPALPAENQIRDDLDGPAFALEGSNIPEPVAVGATVSTISERKRSKRLTKTVDPTKKVVFDGIATSNIIPSDGWGPQRTTRRAAKSNTQQTAYLPDASRAVEQKPRLQSAEKPPTSSTAPGAKLGHMAGKRKYHTDVIEVQNPDGTFRVIAEDGVFLDGTPVEPPSDQGASVIDENPSTSGRRSLRSRISSATPMGPQHTATEKTHHGLPLALSSPSTSRLDPHSKRKVVDVSASVTIETLQDSPMGHTIEESKLARTRSVPVSKRKASNVHKQTVVQATSGEVAIGGLALLGASDPVASHQSRSKRTGQPSRAIQPQVALRPANEAEPSTSSRTSARKKAKAADHLSEGTPEVPLAVQTSTQQSVHASAAHGNAEDDHVVRNVENHVPTSNGTVRSRNAGSNGPIQQLDEFLASQKVQTVTLAQRIQEAQDTTQESLYEIELKMQETMRQMQNLAQRMIAQNLALVKEQQQRSVDNEKAVLKLREQLASSATQPPAPIVRRKAVAQRSEANLIDQQQLSTRHEENSVRMPEEQTSSAAMRPAPRLSKKQVSSRQKGSVSIIQESEQRRSAPKKRKADNDGDYQHDETGKGKKKKKDGNEERSRSDALGGDSRLINRPKKNYSIPDMDLAMSDADAEQPLEHEHEQEPKRE